MRVIWKDRKLRVGFALEIHQLLEIAYWCAAVTLGCLQAWPARFQPSTMDLVSYLDIGDAYMHGHWKDAINGYWNPLYSWILGVAMAVVQPSAEFEYTIAKAVDVVIYVFCLFCFARFLAALRTWYRTETAGETHAITIPDWAWVVIGYTLFIWSSVKWVTLTSSTPDMCAAALAYLAWSLYFRAAQSDRRALGVFLGGALAFGYFSRTPMFVVGCVILLFVGAYGFRHRRTTLPIAASLVFVLLTAPFIVAVSSTRGHLTIGDNGKLNHAWLANPGDYVIPNRHWQGGPSGYGAPVHPSRILWNMPPTFEFAEPIGGTFPPWTDPSYWYEGLRYHFDAAREWKSLRRNLRFYNELFGKWLLLLITIALLCAGHLRSTLHALARNVRYWAPAAAGLLLYLFADDMLGQWTATTTQPPSRYVAVFIVLLSLIVISSLRFRHFVSVLRTRALAVGIGVLSVAALAWLSAEQVQALAAPLAMPPWQLARAIEASGVTPGMRVATIGSPAFHEFWARLDRVQVIAEIPESYEFWTKEPATQTFVLGLLSRTGAQAVISAEMFPGALQRGWLSAKGTDFGVFLLNGPAPDMSTRVWSPRPEGEVRHMSSVPDNGMSRRVSSTARRVR